MHHYWLSDKAGHLLDVSSSLCRLLGYSRSEILGMMVIDLDEAAILTPEAEHVTWQTQYITKSGQQVRVECCCHYSGHGGGQYSCFVEETPLQLESGAGSDSADLLKMILDAQQSNIVLFDCQKRVTWFNKLAAQTAEESGGGPIVGRCCSALWSNCQEGGCDQCPLDLVMETKLPVQKKMSIHDGRRWRVSAVPILQEDGEVQHILFVGVDITEYLTLAEGVRKNHKLESLGTLAGGIAHDFNNILSGIIGYTELALMHATEDSDLKNYLFELSRAGQRATELVRQILTFSRGGESKLVRTDLPALAHEVLQLLRSTLPATIELKKEIITEVNPVLADPVQIHQIIMNLCTNASHAMEPSGGVLSVEIGPAELPRLFFVQHPDLLPGEYLRLSVGDTGSGMSQDVAQSVFDPYFTTKPPGQGTGLGLSVVHGIVKECGGHIQVESEEGKGSVFTIYLPTVQRRESGDALLDNADMLRGAEKIMVVDDEPVVLEVTKTYLEMHGYTVIAERNSQKALEIFREAPLAIDMLVSDVTMPHLTGDRLAREFLAIRRDLPIILMTGYSDLVTEQRLMREGVKALVMKPLVGAVFLGQVRRLLDEAHTSAQ